MTDRRLVRALLGFALVLLVVGCGGGSKVKVAEVSGVIRLDDQPIGGAEVNFLGPEFAGIATTGPDGRYELKAQVGENKIYVSKLEGGPPGIDPRLLASGSEGSGGTGGAKQLFPSKYSDSSASELRFTVPDRGSRDANFDLKSR
ncbi:MAG: hypothetical protein KJ000_30000 [Pirellulaceae bacterium]|nr:hypothetical protein [Pirellulaceae bacterium]